MVGRLKGRQERCGKKGFCLHWAEVETEGQIREILLLCLGHGKWTLLGCNTMSVCELKRIFPVWGPGFSWSFQFS